jgi:hypothetical protein
MECAVTTHQIISHKVIHILHSFLPTEARHNHKLVGEPNLDPCARVLTLALQLVQLNLALVSECFALLVLLDQSNRSIPLNPLVIVISGLLCQLLRL